MCSPWSIDVRVAMLKILYLVIMAILQVLAGVQAWDFHSNLSHQL